ncbi:MAG: RNA 2',3'-cyclic phosphodiesterase [Candidatus Zixiibacteriota bacterium]
MIRLFIALPLEKKVKDELGEIIVILKQKGGSVKWVNPKNIHLTLKFLGDTEEHLVDEIKEQINVAAEKYEPVQSGISHIGAFPNLNRPRVIWAGIEKNKDILMRIAGILDKKMNKLGWERETRKFKSHLTLGRIRNLKGLENLTGYLKENQLKEIALIFDRITLFKSTLTPTGPIYDCLHEVKLITKSNQ